MKWVTACFPRGDFSCSTAIFLRFASDRPIRASTVPDSGIVVARPPGLPPRLSLSPARLLGAGWASLLVSGAAKEAVLQAAAEREHRPLPVDLLLGSARGLDVYWAKE